MACLHGHVTDRVSCLAACLPSAACRSLHDVWVMPLPHGRVLLLLLWHTPDPALLLDKSCLTPAACLRRDWQDTGGQGCSH